MAIPLTADERKQRQFDLLWNTLEDNELLPHSDIPALNKQLATDNKMIIKAINELLNRLVINDTTVFNFNAKFNELVGNPELETGDWDNLKKIDRNVIRAIYKLYLDILALQQSPPAGGGGESSPSKQVATFLPIETPSVVGEGEGWLTFLDNDGNEKTITFDQGDGFTWSYVTNNNQTYLYPEGDYTLRQFDTNDMNGKKAGIPTRKPSAGQTISDFIPGPNQTYYYYDYDNGYFIKMDANANEIWRYYHNNEGFWFDDYGTWFTAAADGTVFVNNYDDLVALKPDGTLKWNIVWQQAGPKRDTGEYVIGYGHGNKAVGAPVLSPDGTKVYILTAGSSTQEVSYQLNEYPTIYEFSAADGQLLRKVVELNRNNYTTYWGSYVRAQLKYDHNQNFIVSILGCDPKYETTSTDSERCGAVYSVNSQTGAINWNFALTDLWSGTPSTNMFGYPWMVSTPQIASDNTIYVFEGNTKSVVAINPNGTLKWKTSAPVASAGEYVVDPDNCVNLINNDTVVLLSDDEGLVAVKNGAVLWTYTQPGDYYYTGILVDAEDNCYFSDATSGMIRAVDENGILMWSLNPNDITGDTKVYKTLGKMIFTPSGNLLIGYTEKSQWVSDFWFIPIVADYKAKVQGQGAVKGIGQNGIIGSVLVLDKRPGQTEPVFDARHLTHFELPVVPLSTMTVYINGLTYEAPPTCQLTDKQVKWLFDETNGGFNLESDFDLRIYYNPAPDPV